MLLPPARYGELAEMRTGKYCILSRGPWPAAQREEAIEIMWEDGSESPYALHLTPESFDLLPAEPPPGRDGRLPFMSRRTASPTGPWNESATGAVSTGFRVKKNGIYP